MWTILEVDHLKDLVRRFGLFLRQLVSERAEGEKKKKVLLVSWVIIRDENVRTNSGGRCSLLLSGCYH